MPACAAVGQAAGPHNQRERDCDEVVRKAVQHRVEPRASQQRRRGGERRGFSRARRAPDRGPPRGGVQPRRGRAALPGVGLIVFGGVGDDFGFVPAEDARAPPPDTELREVTAPAAARSTAAAACASLSPDPLPSSDSTPASSPSEPPLPLRGLLTWRTWRWRYCTSADSSRPRRRCREQRTPPHDAALEIADSCGCEA